MNILCTICARGGSKGVKRKNLLKINNKTLIELTHDLSKNIKEISNISFSSDSKEMIEHAKELKIEYIFNRPLSLARSNTPKILAIRNLLINSEIYFKKKFNFIVDLDVTAPLRSKNDIKKCISKIIKRKLDIVLTVNNPKRNPYFNIIEKDKNNNYKVVKKAKKNIYSRQSAPKVYDLNPSIYVWRRNFLLKTKNLFSGRVGVHLLSDSHSIDIDSYEDYLYLKYIMEKKK